VGAAGGDRGGGVPLAKTSAPTSVRSYSIRLFTERQHIFKRCTFETRDGLGAIHYQCVCRKACDMVSPITAQSIWSEIQL